MGLCLNPHLSLRLAWGPGTHKVATPARCQPPRTALPALEAGSRGRGWLGEVTLKVPKLMVVGRSIPKGYPRPLRRTPRPTRCHSASWSNPPARISPSVSLGRGGVAHPAFGRPRLQLAAPASGCGSHAPALSARRQGPRGWLAAEQPAGRGILAAAADSQSTALRSAPPPSLPGHRLRHGRGRLSPFGWLRSGGRGRGAVQGACLCRGLRAAPWPRPAFPGASRWPPTPGSHVAPAAAVKPLGARDRTRPCWGLLGLGHSRSLLLAARS